MALSGPKGAVASSRGSASSDSDSTWLVHPLSIYLASIAVTGQNYLEAIGHLTCLYGTSWHVVDERIHSLKVEARVRTPLGLPGGNL